MTENKRASRYASEHLEHQREVLVREVRRPHQEQPAGRDRPDRADQRKQPHRPTRWRRRPARSAPSPSSMACTAPRCRSKYGHVSWCGRSSIPRTTLRRYHLLREADEHPEWEWRLNADVVSIALIINELLYNAIKHTPGRRNRSGLQRPRHRLRRAGVTNRPRCARLRLRRRQRPRTGLTLITSLLPLGPAWTYASRATPSRPSN